MVWRPGEWAELIRSLKIGKRNKLSHTVALGWSRGAQHPGMCLVDVSARVHSLRSNASPEAR